MKPTLKSYLIGLSLTAAGLFAAVAQAQQTIQLNYGIHLITAEVAANDATRTKGLMFRKSLEPNHGMLFIFDRKEQTCMWMRNTLIPLSVAFIDDEGKVVNIETMEPQTENNHCAQAPIRFALEMDKGWFAKRGITTGSQINGIPKVQSH